MTFRQTFCSFHDPAPNAPEAVRMEANDERFRLGDRTIDDDRDNDVPRLPSPPDVWGGIVETISVRFKAEKHFVPFGSKENVFRVSSFRISGFAGSTR